MLLLAYLAGVLTILNPCVLPLVPLLVAGARSSGIAAPLALAMGLAVAFAAIGTVVAGLGREIGDTGHLRSAAAVLMTFFGLALLIPAIGVKIEAMLAPLSNYGGRAAGASPSGLLGVFGVGAALAIAWAPCVGPTLGATVALAASGQSLFTSFAAMAMFGLGAATSLLAAGYGLGLLATRSRLRLAKSAALGRVVLGVTFLLVGAAILSGYDKLVEQTLVEAMPDWLVSFATAL